MAPSLIILGGLPGSGKTTLAQRLAKDLSAVYLRIDTIEQRLIVSENITRIDALGYDVACDIAKENLQLGMNVVADSVNPVEQSRLAWREIANQGNAVFHEIEIICSNKHEHKDRVENRKADIPNHVLPTWDDVLKRDYEPWNSAVKIDTSGKSVDETLEEIMKIIQ